MEATVTHEQPEQTREIFYENQSSQIIDATIVVKPPSKGGLEEGKKDLLSKKVKDVEESIKHGLHLESKET